MSATTEIRPGSVAERDLAVVAAALGRDAGAARIVDSTGSAVDVPDALVELLRAIVEHLQAGNGVAVSALHAELTTAEAAQLLGVSRPHVIKLLDESAMPHRLVGTHRRIRLADVLVYRDRQDERARQALDELTRQSEELGLYDD